MTRTPFSLLSAALIAAGASHVVTPSAARAQGPSGNPYTVANVTVEARAANAVEAKQIAISAAQTKAFRVLLHRLTDFRLHARLPPVQPSQVERVVTNLDVRNEGFSGTVYRATFDVGFADRGVKSFLNEFALPYTEERSPSVLIVPVYIVSGSAQTSDRNEWRNAFAQMDLRNALVPLTLAPVRADLTAPVAKAFVASPESALGTLRNQHKTQNVVLAVAELEAGGDAITLRLVGSDSLGLFTLERRLRTTDMRAEDAAAYAAGIAYGTLQERWKLTRSASGLAAAGGGGPLTPVLLTAEFSGLREWQAIRGKLQRMPGLQNFEVRGVNPRAAQIMLEFPGGATQLARVAGAQGLAVEEAASGWVVRSR